MYHHHSSSTSTSSSSSFCYGSNNNGLVLPPQPDAAANFLLSSIPPASGSSYGYYSQSQSDQQPGMQMQQRRAGDVAAGAAVRYSAEERRERIEKYRTKRNQRNFQKKITYACRKTLADSRPRVKGRFARNLNDDHPDLTLTEVSTSTSTNNELANDSSSMPEWWPAMQGAMAMEDEDEDLVSAYLAVSSINLY